MIKNNVDPKNRIAIFGLYKTGTTAVYSNILNSLDYSPRCLFEESKYHFLDSDLTSGVLAKVIIGHPDSHIDSFHCFEKKILITRDPRDWLISGCLFLTQEIQEIYLQPAYLSRIINLLRKKEDDPGSVSFLELLKMVLKHSPLYRDGELKLWLRTMLGEIDKRVEKTEGGVVLKYEDFVSRNISHLSSYLDFSLNDDVQTGDRFSHVYRSGTFGNWQHWFTKSDITFFKPLFSEFLKIHYPESHWQLDPSPVIPSSTSSEYVTRIVQQKIKREKPSMMT